MRIVLYLTSRMFFARLQSLSALPGAKKPDSSTEPLYKLATKLFSVPIEHNPAG